MSTGLSADQDWLRAWALGVSMFGSAQVVDLLRRMGAQSRLGAAGRRDLKKKSDIQRRLILYVTGARAWRSRNGNGGVTEQDMETEAHRVVELYDILNKPEAPEPAHSAERQNAACVQHMGSYILKRLRDNGKDREPFTSAVCALTEPLRELFRIMAIASSDPKAHGMPLHVIMEEDGTVRWLTH